MNEILYKLLKRDIDVLFSVAALIASAPIILISGLALKLDSKGPLFYRSRRLSKNWREFDLMKLRTMVQDDYGGALQVTSRNDTRITRVGRLLRGTKIDELPQFWNVLIGDISLVGPRPEVPKYAQVYSDQYSEILNVKPGLTDWATLQFIDEETILAEEKDPEEAYLRKVLPKKIELYLEYVRNPSIMIDLIIIAKTATMIVRRALSTLSH